MRKYVLLQCNRLEEADTSISSVYIFCTYIMLVIRRLNVSAKPPILSQCLAWWNYANSKSCHGNGVSIHEKCSACFLSNIHIVVFKITYSNLCNKLMLFLSSALEMQGWSLVVRLDLTKCFIPFGVGIYSERNDRSNVPRILNWQIWERVENSVTLQMFSFLSICQIMREREILPTIRIDLTRQMAFLKRSKSKYTSCKVENSMKLSLFQTFETIPLMETWNAYRVRRTQIKVNVLERQLTDKMCRTKGISRDKK